MPWRVPDDLVSGVHEFQNHNDELMFERAFQSTAEEEQKMVMALYCASPDTPEKFIRRTLQNQAVTNRTAPSFPPPTIEEVFARSQQAPGDNVSARQMGAH